MQHRVYEIILQEYWTCTQQVNKDHNENTKHRISFALKIQIGSQLKKYNLMLIHTSTNSN